MRAPSTDGSPTVCKRDTGLVCSPRSRRSADEESNRLQERHRTRLQPKGPPQRGRRKQQQSARETQDSSAAQGPRRSADGESDVCKRHELGRNCVCVKPFLCYNCYNREKNLKSFSQKLRLWVGPVQSALRLNPGVEPYYISSSFGGKYPQDLRIPCCLQEPRHGERDPCSLCVSCELSASRRYLVCVLCTLSTAACAPKRKRVRMRHTGCKTRSHFLCRLMRVRMRHTGCKTRSHFLCRLILPIQAQPIGNFPERRQQ